MPNRPTVPPRDWMAPVGIVAGAVALIALVLALMLATRPSSVPLSQQSGSGGMDLSQFERRDPDDRLAIGPVNAPVALVVFSDYQCQYCAAWNQETLPKMMEFVDAGDLRIEWRDVNVYGGVSERAARAAYAAALQNRLWDYHGELFADGKHLPASQLTRDALVDRAGKMGMDRQQFITDMESETTRREMARNEKDAEDLGVSGTPTYVLGGRLLVGALPTSDFLDTFDDALASSGR